MKKQFPLSRLSALCLGLAALGFAACGDDEESTLPPGGTDVPGGGTGQLPADGAIPTVADPVTTVVDAMRGERYTYTWDDAGRLVGGSDFYASFSITFSPLAFHVGTGGDVQDEWESVATDDAGRMTRALITAQNIYDGSYGHYEVNAGYDADGRLVRYDFSGEEDGIAFTDAYTLEYAEGKLRRIENQYEDAENYISRTVCTYTYDAPGARPNNGIPFFEENIGYCEPFMFLGGYFGTPSAEVPGNCRVVDWRSFDGETSESKYVQYYEVTYDDAGRVSSFTAYNEQGNTIEDYRYYYGGAPVPDVPSAVNPSRPSVGTQLSGKPLASRRYIHARRAVWKR